MKATNQVFRFPSSRKRKPNRNVTVMRAPEKVGYKWIAFPAATQSPSTNRISHAPFLGAEASANSGHID